MQARTHNTLDTAAVSYAAAQLGLACHPGALAPTELLNQFYAPLLQAGLELPLNLVSDLAALVHGPRLVAFAPPQGVGSSVRREVQTYAELLNRDLERGPVRSYRTTITRLLHGSGSAGFNGAQRADQATAGAVGFVVVVARHLTRRLLSDEAVQRMRLGLDLPHQLRPVFHSAALRPQLAAALAGGGRQPAEPDADAQKEANAHAEAWWRALSTVRPVDGRGLVDEILAPLQGAVQVEAPAAAVLPGGQAALDRSVLQAALDYRPLEVDDSARRRYQFVRAQLTTRPIDTRPTVATGITGICRKGRLEWLLRSELVRPDIGLRVLNHLALYTERQARQQRPLRVLLAAVLDRGPAMQVRCTAADRQRADTRARVFVAQCLEDVIRYWADLDALAIDVRLVLHNGESQAGQFEFLPVLPDEEYVRYAPTLASDPETRRRWLEVVPVLNPYFFAYEPVWPELPERQRRWASAAPAPPHRRAVGALAGMAVASGGFDDTDRYDLAFALVAKPLPPSAPGRKRSQAGRSSSMAPDTALNHLLTPLAESVVVHSFGFGSAALPSWSRSPLACQAAPAHPSTSAELRRAVWDDLLDNLARF